MSSDSQRYVIVGGNAAGMSAATRLRRRDEAAEVVVFEKGEHVSYASCGLPYHVGGSVREADLAVQTPDRLDGMFDLDVRTGHEVVDLNPDGRTVTVENGRTTEPVGYDALVLAPGAEPIVPPIDGVDDVEDLYTMRTVEDATALREATEADSSRALVVGAGYIGLEVAENLDATGMDVTVAEMRDRVMPTTLGPAMAAIVHNHLRDEGVDLRLETTVDAFQTADDGRTTTVFADGGTVDVDLVVLATGVTPRTDLAEAAGLRLGETGAIAVDDRLRTSAPDVYAVGDAVEIEHAVTGDPAWVPLAGPANRQGRTVADVIVGDDATYEPVCPTAVAQVFDLTVGTVGETAAALSDRDREYERSYTFSPSHAEYYPGAEPMRLLVLFDPDDGTLLGAQAVGGDGVDKRTDVLATAVQHGDTVFDLQQLDLAYAPPYSSAKDPVNVAGMAAGNVVEGAVESLHWDELGAVADDATLVDCRPTEMRRAAGAIDGSINVPLPELRDRADELSGPIVTYCKIGQSSYFASRVLSQRGYDIRNLEGGYSLYREVVRDRRARTGGPDVTVSLSDD
jgi:NADPH-dependent 2,4-dienoyl-CoA reductase/sulfur reductase-like enzyme/rhodanese-related sulfurtransferase